MTSGSELEWDGPVLLSMVDGYFSRVMAFVYPLPQRPAHGAPAWCAVVLGGRINGYDTDDHCLACDEKTARAWAETEVDDRLREAYRGRFAAAPATENEGTDKP